MTALPVVLGPPDLPWLRKLWKPNESVLVVNGGQILWRALHGASSGDRVIGIPELAFAHYRVRKDGVRVLYEMAVAREAKRQGIGRRLLETIGRPLLLKTDRDHEESNAFYLRLGLRLVGESVAKSGKALNHYVWELQL